MQLIKITTTPIEYKLQIDKAALKVAENEFAKITPHVTPSQLRVESQNIKVQLNTQAARDSIGLHTTDTFAKMNGQAGLDAARKATAQYAQIGNKLAQIQNNATVPSVFAQAMQSQPETAMVFVPKTGPDISWQPNSLNIDYTPAKVNGEYQASKFNMEYVPAKYKMDIIQYPKVTIEYIGGIRYVPPSSDPNYEER